MALDLTPEQKDTGRKNFEQAAGDLARNGQSKSLVVGTGEGVPKGTNPDRRDILKAGLAAGAVVPLSAAVYFGYEAWKGNEPVRTALIGCGDEGGILVGDHNPEFIKIVAVSDIRPSNIDRIFSGDLKADGTKDPATPRKGLAAHYSADELAKIVRLGHWEEVIAKKDELKLEAVIVVLPLHLHDVCSIKCMEAGLHVLCEKLMARTIARCKNMIKTAKEKGVVLSVGHQRHYSSLYAHAREVVESGVIGDIKHIRALWHRNNSWPFAASPKEREKFAKGNDLDGTPYDEPKLRDGWCKPVLKEDADAIKDKATLEKYGYGSMKELVRWRLYDRTGGGLMAELGSHQLDASSIFLGKVHPLSVMGVGGKFFYGPQRGNDRESDDGVFVTYEFPGKNHPKGPNKGTDEKDIVVVTYSSFNTNSFESYGECLMGSRGTLIVEEEREVYLFKEKQPAGPPADKDAKSTIVSVTAEKDGKPTLQAASTWGGGGAAISKSSSAPRWDTPVRGYRTEMEHFAYCIRAWQKKGGKVDYSKDDKGHLKNADIIPRCHGEVAMADAILALVANMAMDTRLRIEFDPKWFDPESPEVPETKYGKKNIA